MASWTWLIIGVVLLMLELFVPTGFFLLIFGLGGLTVGLLTYVGLSESIFTQLALYPVVTALLTVFLRKRLLGKLVGQKEALVDSIEGEDVEISDQIKPGELGKGVLRGSTWQVRNATDATLEKGRRVSVNQVDGLTLIINKQ